jgi:hypothetical protein
MSQASSTVRWSEVGSSVGSAGGLGVTGLVVISRSAAVLLQSAGKEPLWPGFVQRRGAAK